jgi:hypothetical protein
VFKEEMRRRLTFSIADNVSVVLADQQAWFFPKPWIEIRPTFRSGKVCSSRCVVTYGVELDNLIKNIAATSDDEEIIAAIVSLGSHLLRANYDLQDSELDELFRFRVGDEASLAWAKEIMEIATGHSGPKVLSGGDA